MTTTLKSMFKNVLLLSAILVLSACGSKLSGTYVGQGAAAGATMTFVSNEKVVLSNSETTVEASYLLDGDKLTFQIPGTVVTTLNKDGSFELPGGADYVKK